MLAEALAFAINRLPGALRHAAEGVLHSAAKQHSFEAEARHRECLTSQEQRPMPARTTVALPGSRIPIAPVRRNDLTGQDVLLAQPKREPGAAKLPALSQPPRSFAGKRVSSPC
jgi:hypothetical protein